MNYVDLEPELASELAAKAVLEAVFEFLRHNGVSRERLLTICANAGTGKTRGHHQRLYGELLKGYEDMGVVMATWFSDQRFLDPKGNPAPLSILGSKSSFAGLIKAAGVKLNLNLAVNLIRRSPSIKFIGESEVRAVRRVFVLPEFEVPRAALVIERYLDTLRNNAANRRGNVALLLERSCHAPELDLKSVAPVLRDIKERGTAFIDSIDAEIESRRVRKQRAKCPGEMGVLVFAWTKPRAREP